jgi:hypothetical protein
VVLAFARGWIPGLPFHGGTPYLYLTYAPAAYLFAAGFGGWIVFRRIGSRRRPD